MSRPVVQVEGLSKRYRLGERYRHDSLRDLVMSKLRSPFSKAKTAASGRRKKEWFWALDDVSFDVGLGEVIGIIGRNGAGKTTLLKILSRITEPTRGRAILEGRVASLLEVGTGFHPELTGRENIYLNGAILGMKRAEIERKFDEIVQFAEVDKFLDTPVKHYSSGMYVRLAFSVAAHLEPEVLIIDEVLAVGDATFQKKCLGKMEDVGRSGRTVLFVSHQLEAVQRLCHKVHVLDEGRLIFSGEPAKAIERYLDEQRLECIMNDRGPDLDRKMRLRMVRVIDADGKLLPRYSRGTDAFVEVTYDINSSLSGVQVFCVITDVQNRPMFSTGDCDVGENLYKSRDVGHYVARFQLPAFLNEGRYLLSFSLGVPYGISYDRILDIATFEVVDDELGQRPEYLQTRYGMVVADLPWTVDSVSRVE